MTFPQITVVGNGVQQVGIKDRVAIELKENSVTRYVGAFNHYDNNVAEATYDYNGNQEDEKYLQLNEKAHKAFMSLVGENETLELADLDRIEDVAKLYSLDVDKSKLNKGEVVIKFADGKSMKIDFMTPEEQKEFAAKTSNPVTEISKPIVKEIGNKAEWVKDNIILPLGSWTADKIDVALDRIESWLRTP